MIVKSSPIKDHGETHLRKTESYQEALMRLLIASLVTMAAPSGIPRNTATLVATVE